MCIFELKMGQDGKNEIKIRTKQINHLKKTIFMNEENIFFRYNSVQIYFSLTIFKKLHLLF
jgi:hypothetical protein